MQFSCCSVDWPFHLRRVGLVASLFCGLVVLGLINAAFSVPRFYAEQLSLSSEKMSAAGEQMAQAVEQFNQDITQPGKWRVEFTEAQINAWLATELLGRLPYALPPNVFDPRIAIEPNLAKIAAQYSCGNLAAVLSLEVNPFVASTENDVAIRIRAAKIGSVPGLDDRARQSIQYASLRSRIRICWRKEKKSGDWVGKFKFDGKVFDLSPAVQLRNIELRDGIVCLSGETLPPPDPISVTPAAAAVTSNAASAAVLESIAAVMRPTWSDEIMPRTPELFDTANASTNQLSFSNVQR